MSTSRRRPAIITAGALGTAALALATSGTLSAFTASITNNANTAGTGTLTMQETNADGSVICDSNAEAGLTDTNNTNATCATINKYGGNLNMASSDPNVVATSLNTTAVTTTINIKNTGTLAASSFTLGAGACTQTANPDTNGTTGTATDLCAHLNVKILQGTTVVYDGTAAALASQSFTLPTVAAGASLPFTFTTSVDPAAGNSYQGLQVSQPLTWTFNA